MAAPDRSEIDFEKFLKLMWYAWDCFVANFVCDWKILLTANNSYKLDLSAFE